MSTKKPARERLHSQAGFSTLLPKIVKASGLGALPCLLVICVSFCCFTESGRISGSKTQKAPETKRSRGFKATPQGLEEPACNTGNSSIPCPGGNAGGNTRDTTMAFDSLAELIALWPSLSETDRADLLCIAKSMATDTTELHAADDRPSSRLTEHFSSRKP